MLERLRSETPAYFKALRNGALTFGTCAFAAVQVANQINLTTPFVLDTLKYLVVACAFIAGTSQLTTKTDN